MLRETVRGQLPTNVRGLWDDIEEFAGTEIAVAVSESAVAACNPNHLQATIFLPDPHVISVNDVLHELLHIRRYWIKMAPQITTVEGECDNNLEIASMLDNILEHQFVIPAMARYGLPADPQVEKDVKNFEAVDLVNSWARRTAGLAMALMRERGDLLQSQQDRLTAKLKSEKLYEEQKVARKVRRIVRTDKLAAARVIRDFYGIPAKSLRYRVYDIRNRSETVGKL